MFSKKKALYFKNELTVLLEDPGTDLEKVLLNYELSYEIQNENTILYKRIFDDDSEWFKKIINYALFDLKPPVKYKGNNQICQINHNASNFLANCQKKFKKFLKKSHSVDYLIKSLNQFISKENRTNKNPMYAGHFQRIVENFIQLEIFDDLEDFLNKIIPFLVENCRILAYQQLITGILRNSCSIIDDDSIYSILTKILYRAFGAVNYIHEHRDKYSIVQSVVSEQIERLTKENAYKKSTQ